jgi:serine/threonine-protein kinase
LSRNGTLAYRTGETEKLRNLEWLDGTGRSVPVGTEPAIYNVPRLSWDGGRLTYTVAQGSSTDVWVYDFQRGIPMRLTSGQNLYCPVWSPDGRFLVVQSPAGLLWMRADGSGKPLPLTPNIGVTIPSAFTPDGTRLAYSAQIPEGGGEIRTVPVDNSSGQLRAGGPPQVFLKTSAVLTFPAFSPDGRWLAYADAEGGSYEVYVRAFPDNGTKVQISSSGGSLPLWSQTAHQLFYRTEDQRIMVANYTVKNGSFIAEKPRVWSVKQLANLGVTVNLDIAPDGKRFIAVMSVETREPRENQSHVTLVTNFFDEVRRRVTGPTK